MFVTGHRDSPVTLLSHFYPITLQTLNEEEAWILDNDKDVEDGDIKVKNQLLIHFADGIRAWGRDVMAAGVEK